MSDPLGLIQEGYDRFYEHHIAPHARLIADELSEATGVPVDLEWKSTGPEVTISRQLLDQAPQIDWAAGLRGEWPAPEPDPPRPRWHWYVHNLVAHPLLVLWPRVGRRLHDATIDEWSD